MIVQGHPSHPGTGELSRAELRAAVAAEAGLPEGTFANLPAAGVEVGEALVDAPEIAAVGFTGSFAGGQGAVRPRRAASAIRCTPRWARSTRSSSPSRRCARVADKIAEGLTVSVSSFGGQLCTKPGVVFVPAGAEGDAFAADLAARLDAAEPQVLLSERLPTRSRRGGPARAARAPARQRPRCAAWASATARGLRGARHAVADELLEEHFNRGAAVAPRLARGAADAITRIEGQVQRLGARRAG